MATTRSRSTSTAKRPVARRSPTTRANPAAKASLSTEAKKVVRSASTSAKRAAKSIPTDKRTLTIAGMIAGAVAAGVALFLGRDRVRSVASTGGEKIKTLADDLTSIAHEKIDQARDNITKFRSRNAPVETPADADPQVYSAVS